MFISSSTPHPADLSHPRLLGDIGGTHARFGWQALEGGPIEHVRVLPVVVRAD